MWRRTDLHQLRQYDGDLTKGIVDSWWPMVNAGYWYEVCGYGTTGGTNNTTLTSGSEYAVPFVLGCNATLNGIAVYCITSAASSTLRAGVRNDSGTAIPGSTVLYDGGTVASTTTGAKTWAPSLATVGGRIYWVTVTAQGGAPAIYGSSIAMPLVASSTAGTPAQADFNTGNGGGYIASGAGQGALPGSYTVTGILAGTLKIMLKFTSVSR